MSVIYTGDWLFSRFFDTSISALHFVFIIILLAPLVALNNLLMSYLLAETKYLFASFNKVILISLLQIPMIYIAKLLFGALNFKVLFMMVFLSYLITVIVQYSLMRKGLSKQLRVVLSSYNLKSILKEKKWLSYNIKITLTNSAFVLTSFIDFALVEIFHRNENAVGHYAAILTLVTIIPCLTESFAPYLKTKVSDLYNKDHGELQHVINSILIVKVLCLGIASILLVSFSNLLLSHFGPSYLEVRVPFIIFCLSLFFTNMGNNAPVLLAYAGRENILLITNLIALVLLVALGPYAVIKHGILGITLLTSATGLLKALVNIIVVNRTVKIRSCFLF